MYSNEDYEEEQEEVQSGNKIMDFYNNNKKLVWLLLGIIIVLLVLSLFSGSGSSNGEGNSNSTLTSAKFKEGVLLMGIGSQYTLEIIKEPSDGYVTSKVFTSSNNSVVSVDKNGVVKANSIGSAKISLNYNKKFTDEINVYVRNDVQGAKIVVGVQNMSFPSSTETITVGQVSQLTFDVDPIEADLSLLKWKSTNESVVTIKDSGIITGVAVGTSIIKVYNLDDKEVGSVNVDVVANEIEVTSITATSSNVSLNIGDTYIITPIIVPDNATNKTITYSSSDATIASAASNDGGKTVTIFAYKEGSAVITLTTSNNKTVNIYVTVKKANNNSNPGGNGGTSNPNSDKGYKISSKEDPVVHKKSNGDPEGFINNSESAVKSLSYGATGKLVVTFNITDSSVDTLKVCWYKLGSSQCDPDSGSATEIKSGSANNSIAISQTGYWVIRVSEYKGTTKKRSTLNWYTWIENSSTDGKSCADRTTVSECTASSDCEWTYNGNYCHKKTTANGMKISWSSSLQGDVLLTSSIYKTATITADKPFYVYFCVANSGSSCSVNVVGNKTNYYDRTFSYKSNGFSYTKSCASGDGGKTHFIDQKAPNGGISYNITNSKTTATIPFCFNTGQSISVKGVYEDGSGTVDLGSQSFK